MQNTRQSAGDVHENTIHQIQKVQIALRNTDPKLCNCTVSWQFLAKSVTDGSTRIYDLGSKKVTLGNGQSAAFEVNSKEI